MGNFLEMPLSGKARAPSSGAEKQAESVLAAGRPCGQVQPLTKEEVQTILDALPQLGKLRVIWRLGSGGFSSVYETEDLNSGALYALKITDPLLTTVRKIFSDENRRDNKRITAAESRTARNYFAYFSEKAAGEAQISRQISDTQCPNLIPVCFTCALRVSDLLGLSYERPLWLIGMPRLLCLDSEAFFARFRDAINESLLLKLGIDLCRALQTMENMGRYGTSAEGEPDPVLPPNVSALYIRPDHPESHLVHRDVKPPNVYVSSKTAPDGTLLSLDFVLGDYGISRVVTPDGKDQTHISEDPYKAPETLNRVAPSSDLYSVAMVMVWLLWGSVSEETFLRLKTMCHSIAPYLSESEGESSPLDPPFFRLARWMNTLCSDPMIPQQEKDRLLQAAGLGICSPRLLAFLLEMLTVSHVDRPCQSAAAMQATLESFRLAPAPAPREEPRRDVPADRKESAPQDEDQFVEQLLRSFPCQEAADPSPRQDPPDAGWTADASLDLLWNTLWQKQHQEFLDYQTRASRASRQTHSALLTLCILTALFSAAGLLGGILLRSSRDLLSVCLFLVCGLTLWVSFCIGVLYVSLHQCRPDCVWKVLLNSLLLPVAFPLQRLYALCRNIASQIAVLWPGKGSGPRRSAVFLLLLACALLFALGCFGGYRFFSLLPFLT